MWSQAVEAISILDALLCLASAALTTEGTMCCPEFVAAPENDAPVFRAKGLRHPCSISTSLGGFVPNDIELGGQNAASLMLLTGPNMGGKSTLIRQVCLATVLAQVGAFVPAESLCLSPVDAIFVRMGARDYILSNQSTFYVELSETAAMLRKASRNSLVALDELGRGTATSDGAAIASAVLDYVTGTIQCRGMFATHYHDLAREHANNPSVSVKHMACRVSTATNSRTANNSTSGESGGLPSVTFLYRLDEGSCPKSYGTNVARLAGLPREVVEMAMDLSEDIERKRRGDLQCLKTLLARVDSWRASGRSLEGNEWEEMIETLQKLKTLKKS